MSKYGECTVCGRKGNINAAGVCYKPSCREAHSQEQMSRHIDKAGRDEMPAGPGGAGEAEAGSGRVEPFEKVEGLADEPHTLPDPDRPEDMAATLDTTRPFSLAGFDFEPDFYEPPAVPPTVRLSTSGNLHFSASAYAAFGLKQFLWAKVLPDRSRHALCILLSTTGGDGFHRLSGESKSPRTPKISVRHVFRGCPALIGKRMILRETDVPGAFVAVLDGEAA